MKFLLDNNVLSEWWKPNSDQNVVAWLETAEWFIPTPVIAEIQEGAEAAPGQARRIFLNRKLDELTANFRALILDWDWETARIWGRLRRSSGVKRQPQPLWDSLIDAMAVRHDLIVATRNSADFRHAKIFSPWDFRA
ncbi:MAG: PIN domain-containing protein [Verrucomicrobia bacterium]|nr:PIN domain-containing protein [Verrucomicrobiota bacterium]MDE3097833.1 PIN domain-containing protein [Verrucomicrobiota bacterium]